MLFGGLLARGRSGVPVGGGSKIGFPGERIAKPERENDVLPQQKDDFG